jgi:hypothetical protein
VTTDRSRASSISAAVRVCIRAPLPTAAKGNRTPSWSSAPVRAPAQPQPAWLPPGRRSARSHGFCTLGGWFEVSQSAFDTGTSRQGAIMIGSAGEITDKLLDAVEALSLDRVFAQVDWGGLPSALVEESIARYATDIAPGPHAR